MLTVNDIATLRAHTARARGAQKSIALVATMGNLHEGHIELIRRARHCADYVVASIFVNPLQFGPDEDFATYPRTLEADRQQLEQAGCDLLFCPSVEAMYPNGKDAQARVSVPGVSWGLCGGARPGHFDGMATIVCKLLNMVQPDSALFGEKDYQQLTVIRAMVSGLDMPVTIIGVPTRRASDGLALSSRNGYLTEQERRQAPLLYGYLQQIAASIVDRGQVDQHLIDDCAQRIRQAGFQLEYLEVRNAITLSPILEGATRLAVLVAARLGKTRLIDNVTMALAGNR